MHETMLNVNERSQIQGHILYNFIHMKYTKQVNSQRQKANWYMPGAEGVGQEQTAQWVWGIFFFLRSDKIILELGQGGGCTRLGMY